MVLDEKVTLDKRRQGKQINTHLIQYTKGMESWLLLKSLGDKGADGTLCKDIWLHLKDDS